jgi:hypothetical protein
MMTLGGRHRLPEPIQRSDLGGGPQRDCVGIGTLVGGWRSFTR